MIVPPGAGTVKGVAYAGGGAGAGGGTNPTTGGGGGGGAYSSNNFTPTAGHTLTVVIGAAGSTGASPVHGGNSSIKDGATTYVLAEGGRSVANNSSTGLAGGASGNGVGDNVQSGGAGANGNSTVKGGGGGSSAGTGATGRAGQGNVGGGNGSDSANLPTGAYAGGNGAKTASAVGTAGGTYGAGGGGAARNNTTARAGGVGKIGWAQITYTTPLASALTDNFDDNSIDAAKWSADTSGGGTIAESGQKIIITPVANDASYEVLWGSVATYDLTSSAVFLQILQAANGACPLWLTVALSDYSNAVRIGIYSNRIYIGTWGGNIDSIALPSTPIWLKISESGGYIYFWYSLDGTSWTQVGSALANPFTMTSVFPAFSVENYGAEASPGAAWFDNFNVAPSGSSIKTIKGLAIASVKTWNGLAIASVKSINGLQ
jgi:hypothetical protein